jgi:hypothetical protein
MAYRQVLMSLAGSMGAIKDFLIGERLLNSIGDKVLQPVQLAKQNYID